KRGSSYTKLSLFAQVNAAGKLQLVDHLGIRNLGKTPEQIFARLESGQIDRDDLEAHHIPASDREYAKRIRNLNSGLPNRYNADPRCLFELSGSAGKVAAFAVRVDTYPLPKKKQVFFIGTDQPDDFTKLRQQILTKFKELPEMCEFMNRDIFSVAERYGKDIFLSIKYIGTRYLPRAYAFKSAMEYQLNKLCFLPKFLPDLLLHYISRLFPQHLPPRLLEYRDRFNYYLILSMSDDGIEESRKNLGKEWKLCGEGDFFECTTQEQEAALLHRFAAAGAAIRYQTLHQKTTEEVLALDIALLGNDPNWIESIPPEIEARLDVS
ncbi:MAG: D-lactate dehydrogenase, partial [Verrucomicrobiota bacterium]|nr:D-lactate dehydrogenase [Verrucomicrobiota bacterium]